MKIATLIKTTFIVIGREDLQKMVPALFRGYGQTPMDILTKWRIWRRKMKTETWWAFGEP